MPKNVSVKNEEKLKAYLAKQHDTKPSNKKVRNTRPKP